MDVTNEVDARVKIYGQRLSEPTPLEHEVMKGFFEWFSARYPEERPLVLHMPNEGHRSRRRGGISKNKWLTKGVADIIIIGSLPFVCEIKSQSMSARITKEQVLFLNAAVRRDVFTCLCYGLEAVQSAITDWKGVINEANQK